VSGTSRRGPLSASAGDQAEDRPRVAGRAGRPVSRASGSEPGSAKRRIGIRELRQHASVYVDLAEKGYTVDITNRGRLVARLVPVSEPGSPLERLIAAGIVEPPEEPGGAGDLEPYPAPASSGHAAGLSGRARRQDRDPGRQQDRGRGGPQDPGAGGQRGRR
jgi:prevent-host-death family protein